jgi:methionine salvage enolase-phosphatase E1
VHQHFVGAFDNIDLKSTLSNSEIIELNQALDEYGVLVFKKGDLNNLFKLTYSIKSCRRQNSKSIDQISNEIGFAR